MKTKLSTKGQIVLPGPVRRDLGLLPGDPLEVELERGRIILTPNKKQYQKARIVIDSLTGLPALTVGSDAPRLSTRQVREILADFP